MSHLVFHVHVVVVDFVGLGHRLVSEDVLVVLDNLDELLGVVAVGYEKEDCGCLGADHNWGKYQFGYEHEHKQGFL